MYLNLVAQFPELVVNVFLLGFRLLAGSLELNQKRPPTGQPENSVWVAGVARRNQFGAYDPEVFPHQTAGVLFNFGFELPHQPRP